MTSYSWMPSPVDRRFSATEMRRSPLCLLCVAVLVDASCPQLNEYIKSTVHSANALVGTCKMGDASDTMAVVDSALKVSTPSEDRCTLCLLFGYGTNSGLKKCSSSVMDTMMAMDTTSGDWCLKIVHFWCRVFELFVLCKCGKSGTCTPVTFFVLAFYRGYSRAFRAPTAKHDTEILLHDTDLPTRMTNPTKMICYTTRVLSFCGVFSKHA